MELSRPPLVVAFELACAGESVGNDRLPSLRSGEAELLGGARLIQFMIGGVDFIPLGELPEGVPVATNGGGYAEFDG